MTWYVNLHIMQHCSTNGWHWLTQSAIFNVLDESKEHEFNKYFSKEVKKFKAWVFYAESLENMNKRTFFTVQEECL